MVCYPSYFQLKDRNFKKNVLMLVFSTENADEPNFNKPYMLYMDPVGDLDVEFSKLISM